MAASENKTVQVNLALEPQTTSVSIGSEVVYAVYLDTHDLATYTVHLKLDYDSNIFRVNSIDTGDMMQDSTILLKSVNPKQGTIEYALGSKEQVSGVGIVAFIKGTVLQLSDNQVLSFNQSETKITTFTQDRKEVFTSDQTVILFKETPITILP